MRRGRRDPLGGDDVSSSVESSSSESFFGRCAAWLRPTDCFSVIKLVIASLSILFLVSTLVSTDENDARTMSRTSPLHASEETDRPPVDLRFGEESSSPSQKRTPAQPIGETRRESKPVKEESKRDQPPTKRIEGNDGRKMEDEKDLLDPRKRDGSSKSEDVLKNADKKTKEESADVVDGKKEVDSSKKSEKSGDQKKESSDAVDGKKEVDSSKKSEKSDDQKKESSDSIDGKKESSGVVDGKKEVDSSKKSEKSGDEKESSDAVDGETVDVRKKSKKSGDQKKESSDAVDGKREVDSSKKSEKSGDEKESSDAVDGKKEVDSSKKSEKSGDQKKESSDAVDGKKEVDSSKKSEKSDDEKKKSSQVEEKGDNDDDDENGNDDEDEENSDGKETTMSSNLPNSSKKNVTLHIDSTCRANCSSPKSSYGSSSSLNSQSHSSLKSLNESSHVQDSIVGISRTNRSEMPIDHSSSSIPRKPSMILPDSVPHRSGKSQRSNTTGSLREEFLLSSDVSKGIPASLRKNPSEIVQPNVESKKNSTCGHDGYLKGALKSRSSTSGNVSCLSSVYFSLGHPKNCSCHSAALSNSHSVSVNNQTSSLSAIPFSRKTGDFYSDCEKKSSHGCSQLQSSSESMDPSKPSDSSSLTRVVEEPKVANFSALSFSTQQSNSSVFESQVQRHYKSSSRSEESRSSLVGDRVGSSSSDLSGQEVTVEKEKGKEIGSFSKDILSSDNSPIEDNTRSATLKKKRKTSRRKRLDSPVLRGLFSSNGSFILQVPEYKMSVDSASDISISLLSAVHMGSEEFYRYISSSLHAADLVLLEGMYSKDLSQHKGSSRNLEVRITAKNLFRIGSAISWYIVYTKSVPKSLDELVQFWDRRGRSLRADLVDGFGNQLVYNSSYLHENYKTLHTLYSSSPVMQAVLRFRLSCKQYPVLRFDALLGLSTTKRKSNVSTKPTKTSANALSALPQSQNILALTMDLAPQVFEVNPPATASFFSDMSLEALSERMQALKVSQDQLNRIFQTSSAVASSSPLLSGLSSENITRLISSASLRDPSLSISLNRLLLVDTLLRQISTKKSRIFSPESSDSSNGTTSPSSAMDAIFLDERNEITVKDLELLLLGELRPLRSKIPRARLRGEEVLGSSSRSSESICPVSWNDISSDVWKSWLSSRNCSCPLRSPCIRRIALFYGAAHSQDLIKRLQSSRLRCSIDNNATRWHTAMKIENIRDVLLFLEEYSRRPLPESVRSAFFSKQPVSSTSDRMGSTDVSSTLVEIPSSHLSEIIGYVQYAIASE